MGQWTTLTSHDGFAVPAWQAAPDAAARGAIVVLQEIFGVNAHIRAVVDRLAARGWWAIAPATFERVRPGVDLGYSASDVAVGRALKAQVEQLPAPGVLADIQAAIDHAASASGAKVGIVGFCWGGLLAWRAAALCSGLSAAVPYYGGGMTSAAEIARQPRVPVLAHFGRRDKHIPLSGVQQLAAAHPEAEVHLYDADHGFNCDLRASYDEASAVRARDRTLAFFGGHLR
ncbi:dienelactone hydrolase family protein [Comamonas sp. NLF-1-9]|uniref:dienelactone hydrolase family protein n=1 Tax=Comamonas sp. NLF-1-9 TaxID=2853163 RepID=UPI001C48E52F|nr:dienelactone hydrolase family protein [Comamonas sp. NLF-1-9]QXL83700.1 dienelactone hydrolase family protein [Comamonas sp. NLF-1-9]